MDGLRWLSRGSVPIGSRPLWRTYKQLTELGAVAPDGSALGDALRAADFHVLAITCMRYDSAWTENFAGAARPRCRWDDVSGGACIPERIAGGSVAAAQWRSVSGGVGASEWPTSRAGYVGRGRGMSTWTVRTALG